MDDHTIEFYITAVHAAFTQAINELMSGVKKSILMNMSQSNMDLRETYFNGGGKYGKHEQGYEEWKQKHVRGCFVDDPHSDGYVHRW